MKRLFTLLAITALLFTTSACSAKKTPDQSAVKGRNILAVLKDMRAAYEKKDLSSFMDNVAPGYQDREALSKSLADVFLKNETIHFNIQYTKMLITVEEKGRDQGNVQLGRRVDSRWRDDPEERRTGHAGLWAGKLQAHVHRGEGPLCAAAGGNAGEAVSAHSAERIELMA